MKRTTGREAMQTVAVYCEPKIRTYGFHVDTDLCLMEFSWASDQLASLGRGIMELGDLEAGFVLVFGQMHKDRAFSLFVLTHDCVKGEIDRHMQRLFKDRVQGQLNPARPVDVVSFQGPHFGDRYGIAHAVFEALAPIPVPLLAAVCSTACVYLVLPGGKGRDVKGVLEGAFEVPRNRRIKKDQPESKDP